MARTGRFGPTGVGRPGFSVRFESNAVLRLAQEIEGKFRFPGGGFQDAISEANDQAGIVIQEGMVKELQRRVRNTGRDQTVKRPPGQGKQALERSLLHENNRLATASTLLVGRESWLEQSPAALYWRQIEEGNPKVYTWSALFTNDMSRFYYPWSPGGSSRGHSRAMPPGYPHGRMPQMGRGAPMLVGPFPDYRYSRGGEQAADRFDWAGHYKLHLQRRGLDLSTFLRR